jgi:hypothetical protein
MKTVLSLLFTFLAFSTISFASDIPARTQDGRDVILREDGTWEFVKFVNPFELKGKEQAEEFVKHMQCSRGGTIDQYLNKKAEIPSVEDLGWHVYTKEDGFEVERILLIRQKIESKYRWYIYKTGKVSPLNGKAKGITKE